MSHSCAPVFDVNSEFPWRLPLFSGDFSSLSGTWRLFTNRQIRKQTPVKPQNKMGAGDGEYLQGGIRCDICWTSKMHEIEHPLGDVSSAHSGPLISCDLLLRDKDCNIQVNIRIPIISLPPHLSNHHRTHTPMTHHPDSYLLQCHSMTYPKRPLSGAYPKKIVSFTDSSSFMCLPGESSKI